MDRDKDVKRTKRSACLVCGYVVNALGTGDPNVEARPKPGDVTICMKCGAVMMLANDLTVRPMTEAEAAEITMDHAYMEHLRKVVKTIHLLRALKVSES